MNHHRLPVSPSTVHWGYFSKAVRPALTIKSGDRAICLFVRHHGDPGFTSRRPLREKKTALEGELEFSIFTRDRDLGDKNHFSGIEPGRWARMNDTNVCLHSWRPIGTCLPAVCTSHVSTSATLAHPHV